MYLAVVFSLLTSTRQAVFKLMGQSGGNVNFTQKKVNCLGSCTVTQTCACNREGGYTTDLLREGLFAVHLAQS